MIYLLIGRHITDECAEIVMAFFNTALVITNCRYRFPIKVSNFRAKSVFEQYACSGVKTYVSCSSCHSIYDIPQNLTQRKRLSKCTYLKRSHRCNNVLYDTNRSNNLVPRAYYLYNSVIEKLKKNLLRDGFAVSIYVWKKRQMADPNCMFDCYDGDVFKNFKLDPADTDSFVDSNDHNHLFSFNVDWFQKLKSSVYSCAAIYSTTQNLPRSIPNLRENMIFVGWMPGSNGEASLDQINHYLKPLVDDLLLLMNGVEMRVPRTVPGEVMVKGACALFVCDLPAAAKAIGFSSFNSTFACRRCDVAFLRLPSFSQPDFSNINVYSLKQKRTRPDNIMHSDHNKTLTAFTARSDYVREHGSRWSQFHELPYMDVLKFTVFNPMHNVWLGTCKRIVMSIFLKRVYLTKTRLSLMCQNIVLPIGYDSTSLSKKIKQGPGFSWMKADEWRVFTVALSPLLLKSRLDTQFYENWMIFVKCVQLMSLPAVSRQDVEYCHNLIKDFAHGFLRLCGKEEIVSNLHCHFI